MLQAWHLCLAFISLHVATCEEPQSEGFSSTTLLDLSTSLSHLEGLDSTEHASDGFPEADFHNTLLQLPQGSGSSSQETEEVAIFQSPKYFWEDETVKVNTSNEEKSGSHTDDSETTDTYGVTKDEIMTNSSSSPKEILETSTTWLPTDSDETPKQVAPAIKVLAEENTVQPTTQNENMAQSPHIEERTVFKVTSPSSTSPTTKPPRKTKKHSTPRSHHAHHEQGTDHWSGPPADSRGHPADSRGHPAANPPGEHKHNEEQSSSTQPLLITKKQEKVHVPLILSTQRDEERTIVPTEPSPGSEQVICKDWIHLAGKNYVILNMSNDIDCEEFRWQKGQQLLSLLEGALPWKSEPPQRDWVIFLSKPNENDNHLLMTVTEEERVLPVRDVFTALEDIKRSLAEIGIESYSSTVSCQSHPSPQRSDYGTLFIVLVIIGAICVMIIVAGLIYICCQRRLPKMKNMELHFVENGCHDNPTLDVAMDGQSEMQEKKPSLNGDTSHRADGWETLINKTDKEEGDTMEEDTHL